MPINTQPSTINFLRDRWSLVQIKEIVDFEAELAAVTN